MSAQELDLTRGGGTPWTGSEPDGEYVPGTRSNLPANDSLAGLAYMAGVPKLAREMAQSMVAKKGFEEMIAHQVAAGHAFSMNVMCQCNNQFLAGRPAIDDLDRYIEINKTTAATGLVGIRMMQAVQDGMALFDRMRNGPHQRFTVVRGGPGAGPNGVQAGIKGNGAAHTGGATYGAAGAAAGAP
jgi:hypothetical protein